MRSVRIWSFPGLYLSTFGLNTDQKTPNKDAFHAVKSCLVFIICKLIAFVETTSRVRSPETEVVV